MVVQTLGAKGLLAVRADKTYSPCTPPPCSTCPLCPELTGYGCTDPWSEGISCSQGRGSPRSTISLVLTGRGVSGGNCPDWAEMLLVRVVEGATKASAWSLVLLLLQTEHCLSPSAMFCRHPRGLKCVGCRRRWGGSTERGCLLTRSDLRER